MTLTTRQAVTTKDSVITADTDGPYWPDRAVEELIDVLEPDDKSVASDQDAVVGILEQASEDLARQWADRPAFHMLEERGDRAAFEERLRARWADVLDLFDLFVTVSRRLGDDLNARHRPAAAERQEQKFEALVRLHAKAVLTAHEVWVLMTHGLASAAMARWRTIHEIWVTFAILSPREEELSRRYLVHEIVESLRARRGYEHTWERLGYEPPDWSPEEREAEWDRLKDNFGDAFTRTRGWAAPLFDGHAPSFGELAELADLNHWRAFYRMGSHGVHAESKGLMWNMQVAGERALIVAGPSNAGLIDPAQCTLMALNAINAGLVAYEQRELEDADRDDETTWTFIDRHVERLALPHLMEHAVARFVAINEEQNQQEADLTSAVDEVNAVLAERPDATPAEIADVLDTHPDEVEELLRIGAQRGLIDQPQRKNSR